LVDVFVIHHGPAKDVQHLHQKSVQMIAPPVVYATMENVFVSLVWLVTIVAHLCHAQKDAERMVFVLEAGVGADQDIQDTIVLRQTMPKRMLNTKRILQDLSNKKLGSDHAQINAHTTVFALVVSVCVRLVTLVSIVQL
jgi:hypothetical protein